jgi:hypothetical protein
MVLTLRAHSLCSYVQIGSPADLSNPIALRAKAVLIGTTLNRTQKNHREGGFVVFGWG